MVYCRTIRKKIVRLAWAGHSAAEIVPRNPDLAPGVRTVRTIINRYYEHGDYETEHGGRHRAGMDLNGPREPWILRFPNCDGRGRLVRSAGSG